MFECQYCDTGFLTEVQFNKHNCREKERMMVLETPSGITAYGYYKTWFQKKKMNIPTKNTFISSRHYNPFFTFAKFVKQMGIPDTKIYIEFMVERGVMPQHWYHSAIYGVFIDHFDNTCPMTTHTRITLFTMDRLATTFECEIGDVIFKLKAGDLAKLIQSRNLSPWVLLLSEKFRIMLTSIPVSERDYIESVINLNRWKLIVERNRNHRAETKSYLDQLDL